MAMKRALLAGILLSIFLFGGCADSVSQPPDTLVSSPLSAKESSRAPFNDTAFQVQGSGSVKYAEGVELNREQENLLLSFMDAQYQSLAYLELRDPSELFADPDGGEAIGNRAILEYIIATRKMQRTDLSLVDYRYTLTCQTAEFQEDGTLLLAVTENSIQNFAAHPDVDSESVIIYHTFAMVETEDGWRLGSHIQMDSLTLVLFLQIDTLDQSAYSMTSFDVENPAQYFSSRLEQLLAEAEAGMEQRLEDGGEELLSAQNAYDRSASISYAHQWVQVRNDQWEDYGIYGGNCQNYVSQCLYAGGIPMDTQGAYLWKWYSETPDNTARASGRSSSWSSVESFREYAAGNTGYGLVAWVGASYYSGEAGDVLQLGPSDDWRHTVIIVDVIQDDSGQTLDYLVNSNTADLINYPAGAYTYTHQSLIKIYGWNS